MFRKYGSESDTSTNKDGVDYNLWE
jgi:hypothetical protein